MHVYSDPNINSNIILKQQAKVTDMNSATAVAIIQQAELKCEGPKKKYEPGEDSDLSLLEITVPALFDH
jgi:hypothetical protein